MTRTIRDETWLRQAAEAEDQFPSISVGGLATRMGMYPPEYSAELSTAPRVFGELVSLLRRKAGMSIAELAALAKVNESEIERAERDQAVDLVLVSKLAKALNIAEDKLAQLAGITEAKDQELLAAANLLEARLQPPLPLNPIENLALSEFLSAIHQ